MSAALWITGCVWVGCFIAEACDDFRASRALLRAMVKQQRWIWTTLARPFGARARDRLEAR